MTIIAEDTSSSGFDRQWFADRVARAGLTNRAIAARLGVHESAVSRIFRGTRKLHMEEAGELARMLGVSYEELAERAGARVPELGARELLAVAGWVDTEGVVHSSTPPRGKRRVPSPVPGLPGIQPFRVLARDSRLASLRSLDGAVLYAQTGAGRATDPDTIRACLGRLSLVRPRDGDGTWLLRVVRDGYDVGRYDLMTQDGETTDEGVTLAAGAPVTFISLG